VGHLQRVPDLPLGRVSEYEPKWLTDYSNKYMLDYEAKVVTELHEVHPLPEERTLGLPGGRVYFIGPDARSDAYLLVTPWRLLFGLIPFRKPWQHAKIAEIPWHTVRGFEVDPEYPESRWVRVFVYDDNGQGVFPVLIFTRKERSDLFDEIVVRLNQALNN